MDDDGDRQSEESEKEFRIDKTHWSKDTEIKISRKHPNQTMRSQILQDLRDLKLSEKQ